MHGVLPLIRGRGMTLVIALYVFYAYGYGTEVQPGKCTVKACKKALGGRVSKHLEAK